MTRQDIINEAQQIITYLFNLANNKAGFKENEKTETEQKIKQLKEVGFKELAKEPTPAVAPTAPATAKGSRPIY